MGGAQSKPPPEENMAEAGLNNRANQLNPNNDRYHRSRRY